VSDTQFQLVVRKGPKVGQVFLLDAHTHILGRDPMSDFVLNDPEVSRQHARLTRTDASYEVQDLGSTNGTFVDGERLGSEPVPLQPGQTVSMGSGVTLKFDVAGQAVADEEEVSFPPAAEKEVSPPPAAEIPPLRQPEPSYQAPPPPPHVAVTSSGSDMDGNRRRNMMIAAVVIIIACCCLFLLSGYFVWGDPLLEYLQSSGILP
jgi:hypothetical protein